LEYVLNIIFIAIKGHTLNEKKAQPIFVNINRLLNHFNFTLYNEDPDQIKIIVIENNPNATAVAEIVEDNNISKDIIRYNHFMLKGNVYEKKKILTQLYKEFEKIKGTMRDEILKSDLGFLFNSLGIRHEKGDNKITNLLVQKMREEEIEEWCDKVYDIFLLSELHVNYLKYKDDILALKKGEKTE
jgi:hypothetical protein